MSRKVTMKVKEMKDAEVTFISMVKRGAMRTPFKIFKSEDGMGLDLGNLFGVKKSEVGAADLVAIAVSKDVPKDVLYGMVVKFEEEAGVEVQKVDSTTHEQVTLLIVKEDAALPETEAIKLTDDVAVLVTQKSFRSWMSDSNFATTVAVRGFFPGLSLATDSLRDTISKIMQPDEPVDLGAAAPKGGQEAALVSKALDDFKAYVMSLVNGIPQTAWKMEAIAEELDRLGKPEAVTVHKIGNGNNQYTKGNSKTSGKGGLTPEILKEYRKTGQPALSKLKMPANASRADIAARIRADRAKIKDKLSGKGKGTMDGNGGEPYYSALWWSAAAGKASTASRNASKAKKAEVECFFEQVMLL